ncbi:transcription factor atoh8 [Corythoichthys intestinalis]|uniref:transcription factor atoh8 n=1 Tax=Corythoichthys intestinalis TaxID=161448 RepID=UPI0025A66C7E|nr:transcription factor atoh8 [Corythoichthys intestinalis]
MKDPHPLTNNWIKSPRKEPVIIPMQSSHKKFKRKSREPKKIYSDFEPDGMKAYAMDTPEGDLLEDPHLEPCNVTRLAPIHRHIRVSHEASATGILSGVVVAPPQSSALDMRIGSAIAPKLSPLPISPFANPEIVHWPAAISQPLSNRLKPGHRSIFPVTPSSNNIHSLSPNRQSFPIDPSMSGQTTARPVSQTSLNSQRQDHVEQQGLSPKESSRKRVGMSADGTGRIPEVKAVQQTRRLLANARERTRVHTISAAFEALRKQVPCYSYGQKLSKLAILRIACNYILSLAQLAEVDHTPGHGSQSFSQCVEQCTRTLQAEGRSKKRKVGRMTEDV